MRIRLVRIGNSRGVRLPKALLEQVGTIDEFDISVERGAIMLRPAKAPRAGWAESIDKLGPEQASLPYFANRFDDEEHAWE
jgi:antitoxin MazE